MSGLRRLAVATYFVAGVTTCVRAELSTAHNPALYVFRVVLAIGLFWLAMDFATVRVASRIPETNA